MPELRWEQHPIAYYAVGSFRHPPKLDQTMHVVVGAGRSELLWVYTAVDGKRYYEHLSPTQDPMQVLWEAHPLPENWEVVLLAYVAMTPHLHPHQSPTADSSTTSGRT